MVTFEALRIFSQMNFHLKGWKKILTKAEIAQSLVHQTQILCFHHPEYAIISPKTHELKKEADQLILDIKMRRYFIQRPEGYFILNPQLDNSVIVVSNQLYTQAENLLQRILRNNFDVCLTKLRKTSSFKHRILVLERGLDFFGQPVLHFPVDKIEPPLPMNLSGEEKDALFTLFQQEVKSTFLQFYCGQDPISGNSYDWSPFYYPVN